MPGHLTKALVTQWATDAYIAGFQAAMDASGTGSVPTDIDVSIFDPRKNGETSKSTKRNKVNAEERGQLDYDPCKCDARVWNSGFGNLHREMTQFYSVFQCASSQFFP